VVSDRPGPILMVSQMVTRANFILRRLLIAPSGPKRRSTAGVTSGGNPQKDGKAQIMGFSLAKKDSEYWKGIKLTHEGVSKV